MIDGRAWFKSQPDLAPSSPHKWVLIGVFIASRDCPELPFFVPFARDPNDRVDQPVPYRLMMHWLDSSVQAGTDRRRQLLSVRVLRRVDPDGELVGDVRYMCRDIAECALPADIVCGYRYATFGAWCSMPNVDPPGTMFVEDAPEMAQSMLTVSREALIELHRVPAHPSYTETSRVFLAAMLTGRALIAECIYNLTRQQAEAADTTWSPCHAYVFNDRPYEMFTTMLANVELMDFHLPGPFVPPDRFVLGFGTQFVNEPPLSEANREKRIRFTCVGYDITNRDIWARALPPARGDPHEQHRVPTPPIPTHPPLLDDDWSGSPSQAESADDQPPAPPLVGVESNPGPRSQAQSR
jgi:hypothetical protein